MSRFEVTHRADTTRGVAVGALVLAAVFALLGSVVGIAITGDEFANLAHQLNAISYVCLLVYIGTLVGQASSLPSR